MTPAERDERMREGWIGRLMDSLPPGTDVRHLSDGTWRIEGTDYTTCECRTLHAALLRNRAWRWSNGKP